MLLTLERPEVTGQGAKRSGGVKVTDHQEARAGGVTKFTNRLWNPDTPGTISAWLSDWNSFWLNVEDENPTDKNGQTIVIGRSSSA